MTATPTEVAVGRPFVLTIRVETRGASPGRIAAPNLSAFRILGQSTAQPMQFSFGGNTQVRIQSTTTNAYTLVADAAGTYTLQPASVVIGGVPYTSNPVTIEVVEGDPGSPGSGQVGQTGQATQGGWGSLGGLFGNNPMNVPAPDPAPQGESAARAGEVDPIAFVRTTADVADPVVGQQISVTIELLVSGTLRAAPHVIREPATNGFWTQDLWPPDRRINPTMERINGNVYRVYPLRKFAAFPLNTGDLEIGGMELEMTHGGIFSASTIRRTGEPLAVHVRELPSPQTQTPTDPVVGDFTITATLDREQVRTGDALTLRVRVEGEGDVRAVRLLTPRIDQVEVLAPSIEDSTQIRGERVTGIKEFQWLMIPHAPGTFSVPVFALNVWDPQAERYAVVRSEALSFSAAGNAIPLDSAEDEASAEEAVAPPSFPPPRTHAELNRATGHVSSSAWYLPVILGMPLLLLLGAGWGRVRAAQRARPAPAKRGAQRFAEASAKKREGDARGCYAAIAKALLEAASACAERALGGISRREIPKILSDSGVKRDTIDALMAQLEASDFARFSEAGITEAQMQASIEQAQKIADALEQAS